jgi:hypothetical protein
MCLTSNYMNEKGREKGSFTKKEKIIFFSVLIVGSIIIILFLLKDGFKLT